MSSDKLGLFRLRHRLRRGFAVASRLRRDKLALLWVRLGSFWLWGALTGEKLGLLWVRLGSFGFVLGLFCGGRKGKYFRKLLSNKGF
jgi:hypothetical protein